jgi:uncharacterized protein YabE (DUF348 family)
LRTAHSQIIAVYRRLRAQPRNLLAIGLLVSIVSLGPASGRLPASAGADADSKALISLYVDGQQHIFSADDKTVGDVLRRVNVNLGPQDLVEPAAASPMPRGQFNINVYRARPVVVQDGVQTHRINSAYQSPRLLALAAGLVIYPEDKFHTEVIANIVDAGAVGDMVTVTRAKPLNINVDGRTKLIRTQAPTTGDALKSAGVALGAQDTVSVAPTAPVIPGMTIGITRVTEATVTLTDVVPKSVQTIPDPTILKGQSTVKTAGADGQKTITYHIHYKDGVETAREAIQTVSQTAPVTEVVVEGTKVIFAGSVEYWRPQVEAAAAAYGLDPNMMLRIMTCESHGNASDISTFVVNGQHPTGLFQFLPSTWISAGGTPDNILDGAVQVQLAAKKMSREGTAAWQCK